MNNNTKNFLISHGFFIEVTKDQGHNNVYYARLPANILLSPKLPETTFQYYVEEDQIICTDLTTKQQNKVKVNQVNKRVIFLTDIILQSIKRHVDLSLIIGMYLDEPSKVIELLDQDEKNLDIEVELIKLISRIIQKKVDDKEVRAKGLLYHFKLINSLFERGGIV